MLVDRFLAPVSGADAVDSLRATGPPALDDGELKGGSESFGAMLEVADMLSLRGTGEAIEGMTKDDGDVTGSLALNWSNAASPTGPVSPFDAAAVADGWGGCSVEGEGLKCL